MLLRLGGARSFFFTAAILLGFFYILIYTYTSSSGKVHQGHLINRVVQFRFILPDPTLALPTKSTLSPPAAAAISCETKPQPELSDLNTKNQQKPELSDFNTKNQQKPVQLMIITRWRSGSSFAGELFNNNPDFTYFFEPLIGLVGGPSELKFGSRHVEMLRQILSCDFVGSNHTWWSGQWNINCGKSMTFSKTMLCQYFRNVRDLGEKTNRTNIMVQELCLSQRNTAIKTVRVPDISQVESLVSDPNLNVKVINLIRDPRAVSLSRQKTKGVDQMSYSECIEMENNLRLWKDPPEWLKNRHMLLRYEDLAEDPLSITQKMYEFIGVPVPSAVKLWLEFNTNWNEVGEFAHARISSEAAHRWRTHITYQRMEDIQRHCIAPLIMAGYVPITSERDLRNRSVPTLNRYPYPLLPDITPNDVFQRDLYQGSDDNDDNDDDNDDTKDKHTDLKLTEDIKRGLKLIEDIKAGKRLIVP